jgi:hypothetical protein
MRFFSWLHEELIFMHANPCLRTFGPAREQDLTPAATERDRQVGAAETTFAQRLADDQTVFLQHRRVQIFSSQRMTIGSSTAPGVTLRSRRTSR